MENLGKILQARRHELGFSISEMCDKTKISEDRLEAIEAGNIEFFNAELSYLRFYIRYYAQALYLDFDDYRQELDDDVLNFEKTQSLKKIELTRESNVNISKRTQRYMKSNTVKPPVVKRSVDFLVVIFIVGSLVIVSLFAFIFVKSIWPNLTSSTSDQQTVIPPTDTPSVPSSPSTPSTPVTPAVLTITQTPVYVAGDATIHYTVKGYTANDTLKVSVKYASQSWMTYATWVGTQPSNLATLPSYDSSMKAKELSEVKEVVAVDKTSVYLRFGYIGKSTIMVNDIPVVLPEFKTQVDVINIVLELTGE